MSASAVVLIQFVKNPFSFNIEKHEHEEKYQQVLKLSPNLHFYLFSKSFQ